MENLARVIIGVALEVAQILQRRKLASLASCACASSNASRFNTTTPATAIVNPAEGILNPAEDIELPHLSASFTLGNQAGHIWDLRPEIEALQGQVAQLQAQGRQTGAVPNSDRQPRAPENPYETGEWR
ncbi:uncharacterized protein N7515_000150 [Penicillium bovifimosum]|uniref:Uncharacterized protein n=1 Tax=Penicillium bovifimosum TaxID=126998 RepID=A0A9W9LB68_9EURO|nr:uncharacterized protein N7515_000150 [Penicillium bovifimosum]KAJ5145586.1 hypothetical protein N7515_000150 [Penicillium bovifimosum]